MPWRGINCTKRSFCSLTSASRTGVRLMPEVGGELLFEDMMAGGVVVVEDAPADFRVGLVDARFALAAALLSRPGS